MAKSASKNVKNDGLTANQQKAIALLVYDGLTQTQVAERLGVSIKTVNVWVNQNEAFKDAYAKEMDRRMAAARMAFKRHTVLAVASILDLAENAGNEMVRLNAAKEILAQAEKGATLEDARLLAQIEKIKAETKQIHGEPGGEPVSKLAVFEGRKASG